MELGHEEDKTGLGKWMASIKVLKTLDFTDVKDDVGFKAIGWPDELE